MDRPIRTMFQKIYGSHTLVKNVATLLNIKATPNYLIQTIKYSYFNVCFAITLHLLFYTVHLVQKSCILNVYLIIVIRKEVMLCGQNLHIVLLSNIYFVLITVQLVKWGYTHKLVCQDQQNLAMLLKVLFVNVVVIQEDLFFIIIMEW